MRRTLASLALLASSLAVAAVLAEFVLRWRLDEVDYLEPRLERHPVLPYAIAPGSGDHDAWGFRNPRVPPRADVVAIGDSQTYGVSAPARQSWPAWLAALSGRSVYNLALGGYSPPDYAYLLEQLGVSLEPRVVVVGFYFGNDLQEAGVSAEARARRSPAPRGRDQVRSLGGLRTWLAGHSLLYQVVKFELPALTDALRYREAAALGDAIEIEHPVARTFLTPELRLPVLDQSRAGNRRGLAATLAAFDAIDATCRAHAIRCLVLLIPTKESVYGELARETLRGAGYAPVARLVAEEARVREAIVGHLSARGIEWVDPLAELRQVAREKRIYPANRDGHPNSEGYRVIAGAVLRSLDGGESG